MNNLQAKLSFAVSPLSGAIAPLSISGQLGVQKSSYCFGDGLEGIVVILTFFSLCYNSDSDTQRRTDEPGKGLHFVSHSPWVWGNTFWIDVGKMVPKHGQRSGLETIKLGEADP